MGGTVILGTYHPEDDSMCDDGTLTDELNQAQLDGAHVAVLNQASEVNDDPMVLVGCSSVTSTQLEEMPDGIRKELDRHSELKVKTTVKDHERVVKKELKRKRSSIGGGLANKDKEAVVEECHQELQQLLEYFKEVSAHKLDLGEGGHASINSIVACLLEESNLPFSRLVEEIYDKLKEKGVTLASVRSSVLFVGQRSMYGISNADVDVLEDESETSLWCWETRDWKLLPANQRGFLNIRRTARKKIHERISVISSTLSKLATQGLGSQKHDQLKASVKLGKVVDIEGIRLLVGKLKEKNSAAMAEKEAKLRERELMKELDRNKRNAEKEKKKIEREIQKENLQNEKELKRIREEAEKEAKRQEKEEVKRQEKEKVELKKQLKKQQEEVERAQKRREKEEAELKKQAVLQKQANMMERFLKSTKSNKMSDIPESSVSSLGSTAQSSSKKGEVANAATSAMDHILSQHDNWSLEDLQRLHSVGWHKLSCYNRSYRWGVRHAAMSQVVKELKLQKSAEAEPNEEIVTPNGAMSCRKTNQGSEPSFDKLNDDLPLSLMNDTSCHAEHNAAPGPVRLVKKKLLQFAKSYRPAYYGTWSKKSDIIRPRHPFRKDPNLDYEIDSDDEWEEEEPGESLSDCDKENEENIDEEDSKIADEEESEDSFVVPDGYLSENEGAQVESCLDCKGGEASSSPCHGDAEIEEFRALMRQQKTLYNLTEQALRKGQPLVISNFNHEKSELLMTEDLSGLAKLEQLCLQALCMRACTGGSIADVIIVDDNPLIVDRLACQSNSKSSSTHTTTSAIPDSELPEIVRLIRSCPHGLNKVVDLLHQNFQNFSKLQLRNKLREISDFVDNRWQVKKEVLDKLVLSVSPEKERRPKGIAMYFSKRCIPPPRGESLNPSEASPQPLKSKATLSEAQMQPPFR